MPHRTKINGAAVSTDGIMLIRPYNEFSFFDTSKIPYTAQAIVHVRDVGQIPARRSVKELAAALEFVTFTAREGMVAVNPAYAHYTITAVEAEERSHPEQQTKIAWKINGRERFVLVNQPVAEVLAALPKAANHQFKSTVIVAGRPHLVRDIKPTEPGTDVA
ncbi:MAG: hypothetical protein SFW65_00295 [Alphaproteobacteria bacterium]|nr:hypothetical protein [Alphaproteobacteria bacterium]